jgi:hypothetical protein
LIINDAILKACISGIRGIADTLAAAMASSKPAQPSGPVREEPEPARLRQSQQKGVDMRDMQLRADAERRRRPLPRSPAEARGEIRYWR